MTEPTRPPSADGRQRRRALGVAAASVGLLLLGLSLLLAPAGDGDGGGADVPTTAPPGPTGTIPAIDVAGPSLPVAQPDLIVIQTDDQTLESLRVMSETVRLLGDGGMTFSTALAPYPLCCPSRASLLTGQLSHNSGVEYNKPPTGGYASFDGQDATLATAVQEAGYTTIHVGKYLNGYGLDDPTEIPPGWDVWETLVDPSTYRYFRYQVNEGGRVARADPDTYQTDDLFDRAVDAVRAAAAQDDPYLLMLDLLAPHVDTTTGDEAAAIGSRELKTAIPAARHVGRFADEPLPDDPAIDAVDGDEPPFVADRPSIGEEGLATVADTYRAELESLLSVDEGVARLLATLDELGTLDRTVVVFLSDNGFLHGQHRVVQAKYYPWEPSVRIPLLVRGPGVQAGSTSDELVTTVDVTATLLELAGAAPPRELDGRSLVPLLVDPSTRWDREVLLASGPNVDGLVQWAAVRTERWKYVEWGVGAADVDLFDLEADPFELDDRSEDPELADVRADLAARLAERRGCVGAGCR